MTACATGRWRRVPLGCSARPSWAVTAILYQPGGAPFLPLVTRAYLPWPSTVPVGSYTLPLPLAASGLNSTTVVLATSGRPSSVIMPVTGKVLPTPDASAHPTATIPVIRAEDNRAICRRRAGLMAAMARDKEAL